MPLRKMIRSFTDPVDKRTAAELTRQIADFEETVAVECDSIRAAAMPRLAPLARSERSSGKMVRPGQALGVDTSSADVRVLLAKPEPSDEGKLVFLWKRSGVNTLTVEAASGTTIDLGPSWVKIAAGGQFFYCDGEGYWTD